MKKLWFLVDRLDQWVQGSKYANDEDEGDEDKCNQNASLSSDQCPNHNDPALALKLIQKPHKMLVIDP